MRQYKLKIVNDHALSEQELAVELLAMEMQVNGESRLRIHLEEDTPLSTASILSDKEVAAIQDHFRRRCMSQRIFFDSKDFYREQASFLAGVITALTSTGREYPPYWGIAGMSDRPIIEPYKL